MDSSDYTIVLERGKATTRGTPGKMFFGTTYPLYTIEDPVREPVGPRPTLWTRLVAWVASWKVKGDTAIPAGSYRLAWTYSPRFGRYTIQLLDVPGYDGVRIHPGNTKEDTEGCILPGLSRALNGVDVHDSRIAVARLETVVRGRLDTGRAVWLRIMGYDEVLAANAARK